MTDFSTIVKAIFEKKNTYTYINDKEKEMFFFPFNRYMARALPDNAEALNKNGIDTAEAMNLWFNYAQRTTLIPTWFYPKIKKNKKSNSVLDNYIELDSMDKYIIENFYSDEIDKEIKRIDDNEKSIHVKKLKRK